MPAAQIFLFLLAFFVTCGEVGIFFFAIVNVLARKTRLGENTVFLLLFEQKSKKVGYPKLAVARLLQLDDVRLLI